MRHGGRHPGTTGEGLVAVPETFCLRHHAADVLLAFATPSKAFGIWGDYTVVAAAALVDVATLTAPRDTMTRHTRLTGTTLPSFDVGLNTSIGVT
ncbi:hypothetical protein ACIA8K_25125 [Catenuloplanes sp. NPDC051500]|uniref:hypothetical protein n=1 Tax=Catenuloplanes sp. NPDC051500 TaxID=3363959 RepID=UPI0037AEE85C